MDTKALFKLSYGLYIVCSAKDGKFNGQTANTVFQITSDPPTIAVSLNKNNLTNEFVAASKKLTVSVLAKSADIEIIGRFGFKSGREVDKLAKTQYELSANGLPIVTESCVAFLEGEVIKEFDMGTHTIFIAKIIDAAVSSLEEPMTYAHYHQVKSGKTPPAAPIYVKEEHKPAAAKYVCAVCGYVYDPAQGDDAGGIKPGTAFEDLPDTWTCPVCGAGKSEFEKE